MTYILNTPDDQQAMLRSIGVGSIDELFAQIPAELRLGEGDVIVAMGTGRTMDRLERLFQAAHTVTAS